MIENKVEAQEKIRYVVKTEITISYTSVNTGSTLGQKAGYRNLCALRLGGLIWCFLWTLVFENGVCSKDAMPIHDTDSTETIFDIGMLTFIFALCLT